MKYRIPIKYHASDGVMRVAGWVTLEPEAEQIMKDYALAPSIRTNKLIPRTGEVVSVIEFFEIQPFRESDTMPDENNLNDDKGD